MKECYKYMKTWKKYQKTDKYSTPFYFLISKYKNSEVTGKNKG